MSLDPTPGGGILESIGNIASAVGNWLGLQLEKLKLRNTPAMQDRDQKKKEEEAKKKDVETVQSGNDDDISNATS